MLKNQNKAFFRLKQLTTLAKDELYVPLCVYLGICIAVFKPLKTIDKNKASRYDKQVAPQNSRYILKRRKVNVTKTWLQRMHFSSKRFTLC